MKNKFDLFIGMVAIILGIGLLVCAFYEFLFIYTLGTGIVLFLIGLFYVVYWYLELS